MPAARRVLLRTTTHSRFGDFRRADRPDTDRASESGLVSPPWRDRATYDATRRSSTATSPGSRITPTTTTDRFRRHQYPDQGALLLDPRGRRRRLPRRCREAHGGAGLLAFCSNIREYAYRSGSGRSSCSARSPSPSTTSTTAISGRTPPGRTGQYGVLRSQFGAGFPAGRGVFGGRTTLRCGMSSKASRARRRFQPPGSAAAARPEPRRDRAATWSPLSTTTIRSGSPDGRFGNGATGRAGDRRRRVTCSARWALRASTTARSRASAATAGTTRCGRRCSTRPPPGRIC